MRAGLTLCLGRASGPFEETIQEPSLPVPLPAKCFPLGSSLLLEVYLFQAFFCDIYYFAYIHVHSLYVCSASRGRKRTSELLELELQTVVLAMWMLGIEPWSSEQAMFLTTKPTL